MWFVQYFAKIRHMKKIGYPFNHAEETQRDRSVRQYLRDPLRSLSTPTDKDLYALSQNWEPRTKAL